MIWIDVFKIKRDTGYVLLIRTRNSTPEKKNIYCITNKKFLRKLFLSFFLYRVRKRRSQSVLPGRFFVLKAACPRFLSTYAKVLTKLVQKYLYWGQRRPEAEKLAVEKDIHHLLSSFLSFFRSSASAAAVPGLQTDPALIQLGAREPTTVTSHKSCLPACLVLVVAKDL